MDQSECLVSRWAGKTTDSLIYLTSRITRVYIKKSWDAFMKRALGQPHAQSRGAGV